MKILLLWDASAAELGSTRPPLSTGYLAQALEDAAIPYDVFDMKLGYTQADVMKRIAEEKYDAVGITVFTVGHKDRLNFLGKIKKQFPSVLTMAGGPHITIMGSSILNDYPGVDLIAVGEAEQSIVRICNGEDPANIPGIHVRSKTNAAAGTDVSTGSNRGKEGWIQNLSEISWPRYSKFELKKYGNEMGIITSRGCPYSCTFCSVGLTLGKQVRTRPTESVGEELEYWYGQGVRIFNFLDDNFTFYKERVYAICNEIEQRKLTGLTLRASNGVRADRLDYDLLVRMKQVGFRSIGIGVEGGNDKILSILKKGETMADIENAVKTACDLGYEVSLFFVYGTPGETYEDIQDSVKFAYKYPVFKADFYNLMPFPGTQLEQWVNANNAWAGEPLELLNSMDKNLRFSKDTGAPFFTTKELSYETRVKITKQLRAVTLDIQRLGLLRVFKRFGPLKYPMAWLASTMAFQRFFFNNNTVRRISDKFRYAKN